jgi:hypothetical protein
MSCVSPLIPAFISVFVFVCNIKVINFEFENLFFFRVTAPSDITVLIGNDFRYEFKSKSKSSERGICLDRQIKTEEPISLYTKQNIDHYSL